MAQATSTFPTRAARADLRRPPVSLHLAMPEDPVIDPLAPIGHAAAPAPAPLSDMIDRAGAQLTILRRTLDEAAALDRAVRGHAAELSQRVEQGRRFNQEMDARLAGAARAVSVLEAASAAITALQGAIDQIGAAHQNIQQYCTDRLAQERAIFDRRLAEHQEALEARLAEQERRFEERLGAQRQALEARLTELTAFAGAAEAKIRQSGDRALAESDRAAAAVEQRAAEHAGRLSAALDRQCAQTQARVSVLLDSAGERLAEMERSAAKLGTAAKVHADALCERASRLLGLDSRTGVPSDAPAPGSLPDVTRRAEELLDLAGDATLRLTVATDKAAAMGERLGDAVRQAEAHATEAAEREAGLRASLEHGVRAAHDLETSLAHAIASTNATLAQSSAAEQTLVGLRDDLETLASSVRFNLSQAQQADAALTRTVEEARQRAGVLDRAMDQVTEQAAGLVAVAKDVAVLLAQAEATKRGLSAA